MMRTQIWMTMMITVLVLAAGCANQRNRSGLDPAPSQLANDASGGWSVPPGGTAGTERPSAAADDTLLPQTSVRAADERNIDNSALFPDGDGNTGSNMAAGSNRPSEDEIVYDRAVAPEKPVKPIVPAFPVRMMKERVPALKRVFFGFDRWDISPGMARLLDNNAMWLNAHPEVRVRLEGHTDEQGTQEYNLSLGVRRAKAVHEYLMTKGVPPESMRPVSYGEEVPLVRGSAEQSYRQNRRVEFGIQETPRVTAK